MKKEEKRRKNEEKEVDRTNKQVEVKEERKCDTHVNQKRAKI